ncbi:hypothetical protein ACHAQH_003540 [Verticillium albo-atrum]
MRPDALLVLAAFFGPSAAFRRGCRRSGEGEGWYRTTNQDSLDVIAADFCTSPATIRQWNNINNIRPGMDLKVSCRWNAGRQRDCQKNSARDGAYVVVGGDNLQDIAYDFCTTSDVLQRMNLDKITNKDVIKTGWVIQVPCSWN